jgi:hypothetical protein
MSKETKKTLVRLLTKKNARTLAALAAFNNISQEDCALRILTDALKSLHEEMNFQGNMRV